MKKLLLVSALGIMLTGCVVSPSARFVPIEHKMVNKFDVKQAKNQLKRGSSKIEGNAFLRQNGGGVVTCAGQEVWLIPYTEYANEKLSVMYGNSEKGFWNLLSPQYKFTNEDPAYLANMKSTTCDSQGKFVFDNISKGSYFIATQVFWAVGYRQQGGFLMQKIVLNKGESKNIVMSY
ncbi:hypothetical protein NYR72_09890 [Actinobacillus equuli subsp. haemolyticus]|uniref:hypothetical protein n=1 Tax=Actinobacillus equuli TaxID=718 RepID=UPI002418264E|nr:hypothetical protein [Actinobacillus equuli]MDG4948803.1 hypothetical protein [Actinobacillus equuli subsp. haemolyticus]